MNGILDFITTVVVAGGGGGAVAVWLCKLFGEKWLNTKFEERLASLKHEHQKEIERLRLRINTLMDRTTKLHQREFDVLPEAWSRLNDAFAQTNVVVSPIQRYPDLNRMAEEHINEFLKKTPLQEWEKAELMGQKDKTNWRYHPLSAGSSTVHRQTNRVDDKLRSAGCYRYRKFTAPQ
jgi:hypothetical protein